MKQEIQGIDLNLYSYNSIIKLIYDFIIGTLINNGYSPNSITIKDIQLHGSRLRGQAKKDSDLDAVVEYKGNIREDDLFNMLHDDMLYIEDIEVDINPINSEETDMYSYMQTSKEYDKKMLSR